MVLLNGFVLLSKVQALKESVLLGLKDLLPNVLAKSGKEELVVKELGHVVEDLLYDISSTTNSS